MQQEISETLSEETLEKIEMLNIGGWIPVKYKNYQQDVIQNVFDEIKQLRRWLNENNIKLIIEPGRFIAAPCAKLQTTIKNIYDGNIKINCSVYNSSVDTLIMNTRLEVEGELEKGQTYTIKGETPDSMDIFRYKIYLKDPKVGDKLVFLNAGAYNFTTDFCELPKLETEIID